MGRDACIDEPVFFAIRSPTQEVNVNTTATMATIAKTASIIPPNIVSCRFGLFLLFIRVLPIQKNCAEAHKYHDGWHYQLRATMATAVEAIMREEAPARPTEEGPSLIEFLQTLKTLFLQEFARRGKDIRPCAAFLWNDRAHTESNLSRRLLLPKLMPAVSGVSVAYLRWGRFLRCDRNQGAG